MARSEEQMRHLGPMGGRPRRLSWVCAVALAAAAVGAPVAQAAWSSPFNLSPAGGSGLQPQAAVDDDGDAVFTWRNNTTGEIQARARSATGVLSAVQTLSGGAHPAFDPQVAIDASGDAVFTWERSDGAVLRIQARARSADGALSAVQNLSNPGENAQNPQVAVDASGDAVFTWYRFDGLNTRVQAVERTATGALSGVQTLSAAGENASGTQVAVNSDGHSVFTWQRSDGTHFRTQTRARSAAGVLSAVQTLSAAGQGAFNPQVAVDDNGGAVFDWERFDGTHFRIQARARSAAGILSAVETLSAAGQGADVPQVAVDLDGDAVFTWTRVDGTSTRSQTRARSALGALSAVQNLSAAGHDGYDPQVAVDDSGDAVFTWMNFTTGRIQARERSAAGVLGAVQNISASGTVEEPQVAVDADGDAVATWRFFSGTNRIQAAVGP